MHFPQTDFCKMNRHPKMTQPFTDRSRGSWEPLPIESQRCRWEAGGFPPSPHILATRREGDNYPTAASCGPTRAPPASAATSEASERSRV